MGVHGLGIVAVLFRQSHVLYGLPVAGASLQISAFDRVQAMVLDAAPQSYGQFQRLFFAGGAEILRTTVHREGDGVELLFGIERLAVRGEAPVDAAEFGVVETVPYLHESIAGGAEVFFLAEKPVGRRKCPQYAGVQYGSLGRFRIQAAGAVDPAAEPSCRVLHLVQPEGENVVFEFGEDLGPQDIVSKCHATKIELFFVWCILNN